MKVVNSHFRVIIAQKELRERRKLGIRVIQAETNASRSTIERLLNNTIKQVPLDDLGRLCEWVPCDVCAVLKLEDVPDVADEVTP